MKKHLTSTKDLIIFSMTVPLRCGCLFQLFKVCDKIEPLSLVTSCRNAYIFFCLNISYVVLLASTVLSLEHLKSKFPGYLYARASVVLVLHSLFEFLVLLVAKQAPRI